MADFEVRTLRDDAEFEAFCRAMAVGFNGQYADGEAQRRRPHADLARTHAAFAGDAIVGTARVAPTELTVPGGLVAAAGVTNVTVTPTWRRRGVLTQMMRAQLESCPEPVAILIAAEAPIYGRFGYGPATWRAKVHVPTSGAAFVSVPATTDRIRIVDCETARSILPAVYDRFRVAQAGSILRKDVFWDVALGIEERPGNEDAKKRFYAVHDGADGPDGYVGYRIDDQWDGMLPNNTMDIDDLVAATPEAYAALWHYCLTLDWVREVRIGDRPPSEPLPFLLRDQRQVRTDDVTDFVWARILDVPAALAARSYHSPGRVVLEVIDVLRGNGMFALDVGDDGRATCAPVSVAPDVTMPALALGAIYLGGTSLSHLAVGGSIVEHASGAIARVDELFKTATPPWCNTWF